MTFIEFCRVHGVIIDALPREGVWKRYRTEDKPQHRNGAVKYMGDHGFVQNHATMLDVASWHPEAGARPVRQRDEAQIRRQREQEAAYRAQAIRSARAFWSDSRPLNRIHPYIEKKGLSPLGCSGLRMNDGLLVIPVMWNDRMTSIQTITLDGQKRFWPGAPVKGGAYVLDRPRAALTVLCEGLATGLAIFQSVRQARVVVCFDAGNIAAVAERMRPTGSVCVFGDNDHATAKRIGTNPGLDKARAVADRYGYGMTAPQGISGSDAADFLAEVGEGASRMIERMVLANTRLVMT